MHALKIFFPSLQTCCQVNSGRGHIEAVDRKRIQNLQPNVYNAASKPKIKRGLTRKHHRAWTLCEVMKLVDGVARFGAGKWSEIRKLSFSSYSYRTSVDLKVCFLVHQKLTNCYLIFQSNLLFVQDKWRNLIRATQTQLPAQKDVITSLQRTWMPFLLINSYLLRFACNFFAFWCSILFSIQQLFHFDHHSEQGVCPRKINPSIIPIPPSILLRVKELNELQSQGGGFTAPVKFPGQNSKVVQEKGSGFLWYVPCRYRGKGGY